MSSTIHFDTNLIIDFLKGTLSRADIEPLLNQNIIMISVLVEYELRLGQRLSKSQTIKQLVEDFLRSVIIVPLSSEIVGKASEIQSKQISLGKRLPLIDLLIGTTSLIHNAKLLSNDKDMQKLAEYGLEVITF
ncbi:MAG: type II toxin-antitoxin system VapC family toxin [Candidatus Heimdallarchaeota archaeon]